MPHKYNHSKPLTPNRLKIINAINVKYEQKNFLVTRMQKHSMQNDGLWYYKF